MASIQTLDSYMQQGNYMRSIESCIIPLLLMLPVDHVAFMHGQKYFNWYESMVKKEVLGIYRILGHQGL